MTPSVLRAGRPDELLSLIPYLLGFHPQESLVVLAIAETRVVVTARLDLTGAAVFDAPRVSAAALRGGADRLILVTYSDDRDVAADLLDLFVSLADPALEVAEAYAVQGRRFWCLRPGCDCADGAEFDPQGAEAAAAAVYAGLRVVPSRDDLAALVAGPEGDQLRRVEAAYEVVGPGLAEATPQQCRDRLADEIAAFVRRPRPLGAEECAALSMLVAHPEVRDTATLSITRVDADRHVDLWSQVARAAAGPFSVAPVCLAGLAAWVSGDGALLNVCIERAERCDPRFSLLCILRDLSELAVPPQEWDQLSAQIRQAA